MYQQTYITVTLCDAQRNCKRHKELLLRLCSSQLACSILKISITRRRLRMLSWLGRLLGEGFLSEKNMVTNLKLLEPSF